MTTLLGRKLETDWKPLEDLLEAINKDSALEMKFEEKFPGMLSAVFRSIRDLNEKDVPAAVVVYRNFRVQVWPREGFDADPTKPIRVIPQGVSTEINYLAQTL